MTNKDNALPIISAADCNCEKGEYPHLFRLLHWLLAAGLVVLVPTGLSLHAVGPHGRWIFGGVLPGWFWPGRVNVVHLCAAAAFFPAVLAALWVWWRRRQHTRPVHILLLGGGLAMAASGLLLLNSCGPLPVYAAARWTHTVLGLVVLPIGFVWHVATGLTKYRGELVPAFRPWARPQWSQLAWFVPLTLLTACLVLGCPLVHPPWRELVARRLSATEANVGDLAELPWHKAAPLRIALAGGAGFDGGKTWVTLRALHDGRHLFVAAEWLDTAEDRQYMPWKKMPGGWKHLVTDPDDENVYYEDKFSLIFPAEPDWRFERFGCAAHCHIGGGRAYGSKGSDRLVDVWHWKATRTDPVGQVDDKYWSQLDFTAKDVGRHGDPAAGGGYRKNISADKDHPAYLPDDPSHVKWGMIPTEHARPYAAERAATVPAGTIIPGIVAAEFLGDRGDISCFSQHEDGRWRLWLRRKLDTGSDRDVKFVPGRAYPFGCAAFDRCSKRHAYGLSVYRLLLEE